MTRLTKDRVRRRLREGVKRASKIEPKLRAVFDSPPSDVALRRAATKETR